MRKSDLEALADEIANEVERRRRLGGYSTDAEGILKFGEAMLRVLQHLITTYPETKARKHDVGKRK